MLLKTTLVAVICGTFVVLTELPLHPVVIAELSCMKTSQKHPGPPHNPTGVLFDGVICPGDPALHTFAEVGMDPVFGGVLPPATRISCKRTAQAGKTSGIRYYVNFRPECFG